MGGEVPSVGRPVLHPVRFSPPKQLYRTPRADPRGGDGVCVPGGDRGVGLVPGRGRGLPGVSNKAALCAGPAIAVGGGASGQRDAAGDSARCSDPS